MDEAWDQAVARIIASGTGAHRIYGWYGLREYVSRLAEAGVASDALMTRSGASAWLKRYDELMGEATDPRSIEWAWEHSGFRTDRNQDGIPDTGSEAESKPGSFAASTEKSGWRGF